MYITVLPLTVNKFKYKMHIVSNKLIIESQSSCQSVHLRRFSRNEWNLSHQL